MNTKSQLSLAGIVASKSQNAIKEADDASFIAGGDYVIDGGM